jgi:hypothetical protein
MPNNLTCSFVLPANPMGGRLTGGGLPANATLQNGDSLIVVVQTTGNNPPASLDGYFVFTPAPGVTQGPPSPFLANNKYLCIVEAAGTADPSGKNFTFPQFTYGGGQRGSYELTFVAQDPTSGTQWSEDPEFDTGD